MVIMIAIFLPTQKHHQNHRNQENPEVSYSLNLNSFLNHPPVQNKLTKITQPHTLKGCLTAT